MYRVAEEKIQIIVVIKLRHAVAYPGILFGEGSTNSVEDIGQRDRGSGGGSPIVRVLEAAVIWYKKFHFL